MRKSKEGDLYKVLRIEGKEFEVRFGYYSEAERERWEPTPIFPDFAKTPMYTQRGQPFVTAEQDVCEHYEPKAQVSGENWCDDCRAFELREEIIGVCRSRHRFQKVAER